MKRPGLALLLLLVCLACTEMTLQVARSQVRTTARIRKGGVTTVSGSRRMVASHRTGSMALTSLTKVQVATVCATPSSMKSPLNSAIRSCAPDECDCWDLDAPSHDVYSDQAISLEPVSTVLISSDARESNSRESSFTPTVNRTTEYEFSSGCYRILVSPPASRRPSNVVFYFENRDSDPNVLDAFADALDWASGQCREFSRLMRPRTICAMVIIGGIED